MHWVNDIVTMLALIACLTIAFLLLEIVSVLRLDHNAQLSQRSAVERIGGEPNRLKF